MNWTPADYAWMSRALVLARRGLTTTTPNPRVGCVLVRDGVIVGEGWHERAGEPHAEINALRAAGELARGATCYVTLEPCCHHGRTPPCTDALIKAGVVRVIAAMEDPNPKVSGSGNVQLANAGITTAAGLLAERALKLNAGFCRRMRGEGPWVRCKMAISLDGRSAAADGNSRWITGPEARGDVQRLRSECCAVMTGAGTVRADDPRLDVRDAGAGARQPLRVILDRRLRCPPTARMLEPPGRVLILTSPQALDEERARPLAKAGAELVGIKGHEDDFLKAALRALAADRQINELLLESGPTLAGAMLRARLVQELIIYQAPILLGNRGLPMFDLPDQNDMGAARSLVLSESRRVGRDTRYTFDVQEA